MKACVAAPTKPGNGTDAVSIAQQNGQAKMMQLTIKKRKQATEEVVQQAKQKLHDLGIPSYMQPTKVTAGKVLSNGEYVSVDLNLTLAQGIVYTVREVSTSNMTSKLSALQKHFLQVDEEAKNIIAELDSLHARFWVTTQMFLQLLILYSSVVFGGAALPEPEAEPEAKATELCLAPPPLPEHDRENEEDDSDSEEEDDDSDSEEDDDTGSEEDDASEEADAAAEKAVVVKADDAAEKAVVVKADDAAEKAVVVKADDAAEKAVVVKADDAAEKAVVVKADDAAAKADAMIIDDIKKFTMSSPVEVGTGAIIVKDSVGDLNYTGSNEFQCPSKYLDAAGRRAGAIVARRVLGVDDAQHEMVLTRLIDEQDEDPDHVLRARRDAMKPYWCLLATTSRFFVHGKVLVHVFGDGVYDIVVDGERTNAAALKEKIALMMLKDTVHKRVKKLRNEALDLEAGLCDMTCLWETDFDTHVERLAPFIYKKYQKFHSEHPDMCIGDSKVKEDEEDKDAKEWVDKITITPEDKEILAIDPDTKKEEYHLSQGVSRIIGYIFESCSDKFELDAVLAAAELVPLKAALHGALKVEAVIEVFDSIESIPGRFMPGSIKWAYKSLKKKGDEGLIRNSLERLLERHREWKRKLKQAPKPERKEMRKQMQEKLKEQLAATLRKQMEQPRRRRVQKRKAEVETSERTLKKRQTSEQSSSEQSSSSELKKTSELKN